MSTEKIEKKQIDVIRVEKHTWGYLKKVHFDGKVYFESGVRSICGWDTTFLHQHPLVILKTIYFDGIVVKNLFVYDPKETVVAIDWPPYKLGVKND